jgi:hypothetical protein
MLRWLRILVAVVCAGLALAYEPVLSQQLEKAVPLFAPLDAKELTPADRDRISKQRADPAVVSITPMQINRFAMESTVISLTIGTGADAATYTFRGKKPAQQPIKGTDAWTGIADGGASLSIAYTPADGVIGGYIIGIPGGGLMRFAGVAPHVVLVRVQEIPTHHGIPYVRPGEQPPPPPSVDLVIPRPR